MLAASNVLINSAIFPMNSLCWSTHAIQGLANQYSTDLVGWRYMIQHDYLQFLFLLYFICCCDCRSVYLQILKCTLIRSNSRYTKHHQLFYLLVSICRASPQKPATTMRSQSAPPTMFRDLAVPHFRPVPFRILDCSSVPFRSVP